MGIHDRKSAATLDAIPLDSFCLCALLAFFLREEGESAVGTVMLLPVAGVWRRLAFKCVSQPPCRWGRSRRVAVRAPCVASLGCLLWNIACFRWALLLGSSEDPLRRLRLCDTQWYGREE